MLVICDHWLLYRFVFHLCVFVCLSDGCILISCLFYIRVISFFRRSLCRRSFISDMNWSVESCCVSWLSRFKLLVVGWQQKNIMSYDVLFWWSLLVMFYFNICPFVDRGVHVKFYIFRIFIIKILPEERLVHIPLQTWCTSIMYVT